MIIIFSTMSTLGAQQSEPATLPDALVKDRLAFIEGALYSSQTRAQVWWYGWISAYATATIVQGSLAGVKWDEGRHNHEANDGEAAESGKFAEDMLVGSVTTAIGVGGLLLFPFTPAYAPDSLRAMPDGTPEERRLKLTRAEGILRQCAQTEEEGWGWLTHALNIAVNAGAGLATVLAFRRPWTDGLITFAIGEAVSLLNIFTQPRRSIAALAEYNERFGIGVDAPGDHAGAPPISFSFYGSGIGMAMSF